ncbi:ATPase AAA [Bacteroidia bacterium]|nr:ATPase AAA [Bacteroidia bacterium]
MTNERNLPIGIQDFEKLRTENYLYVDKTQYLYNLAKLSVPCFLGRPRRFGKSLFLSTLKAYFLGKKELFEGLAIAELEKEWMEYPVFHLDMNVESYIRLDSLDTALDTNLKGYEKIWGKDSEETTPASRFLGLIRRACEKSGRKVVVLVDEYDKPLVSTMDNAELNEEARKTLKGFYGVLKSADAYLRFVLLTGVTKFSKVSIFSDLNQLQDISMDSRFSGICGITETELIRDFQPELHALAEKQKLTYDETLIKLKKHYDGYRFCEDMEESEDIYNPFSLLNAFVKKNFGNYWYQTGTPTFLVTMLKDINFDIRKMGDNDVSASAEFLTDYRIDSKDPIPVLYQTGYLTIKKYDPLFNTFFLGFPNEEVKYGFLRNLLPAYTPVDSMLLNEFYAGDFIRDLWAGDTEGFMSRMQSMFASIPYDLSDRTERHYQLVFYLLFTLMGQFVQTEVKSARGRADAVVKTSDTIFVFEFKMDTNGTAEDALKQIDEKDYLIPYTADGRKIVKVGAEFSAEERRLSRWMAT